MSTPTEITARVADSSKKYQLDPKALVILIKSQPAGTKFYVRIFVDAPVAGSPDKVFPSAICSSVPVSRSTCVAMAKSALSDTMLARGALVPASVYAPADSKYRAFYLFD